MRKVFSPKILGIQKMQASHGGYALEAEISFSSFSAVLGSPGQCSYTCANAYMDAYMSGMSSRGLQASSIQWGAWAEVGMAARNVDNLRRLEKLGLSGLDPLKGVLLNSYIMNAQGQIGRIPSTVAAADVDWYTFLDSYLTDDNEYFFRGLYEERKKAPEAIVQKRTSESASISIDITQIETTVETTLENILGHTCLLYTSDAADE